MNTNQQNTDTILFLQKKYKKVEKALIYELSGKSLYQSDFTVYLNPHTGEVNTQQTRAPKSVSKYRVNSVRKNGRFINAEYGFTKEHLLDSEFCLEYEIESHIPFKPGNLFSDDLNSALIINKKSIKILESIALLFEKSGGCPPNSD